MRAQLADLLRGQVGFVGIGNVDCADDGFGVQLAEALLAKGVPNVFVARSTPERWIGRIADEHFSTLLFLDAVDFGADAGSLVLMKSAEIAERFPQISTHKISLGVLARCAEANGDTRVWLLGAQPESVSFGKQLSPVLQTTISAVSTLLGELACEGRATASGGVGQ
ncbi:MAG TPA: hydrogenase maturation protease [Terriglobales bacterium]|nr:hydrogenase maturation protease [Terriglobales bacterium]